MSDAELAALSKRAAENVRAPDHWAPLVSALSNSYSDTNEDGTVILGIAENALMHRQLAAHIKDHFDVDPHSQFTYGHGPQGSPRLRQALAGFLNDRFYPQVPATPDQYVITAGVSAMIDHLTWCLCNEGEGILFPLPMYTGFTNDVPVRSRGKIVPVTFRRKDGTLDLDDVFDAEANTRCLTRAFEQAKKDGVRVRAVMITNPHNPLGKCYPPETIEAIALFCNEHKLHYLSDEIYAQSVFRNDEAPNATPFHSVVSLDLNHLIKPERVHVLYGAAKDFCANGLRLGAFYTRSAALRQAMITITTFSWEAYLVQDAWARMLEDRQWLSAFIGENQKLLAHHYDILTRFLDHAGIPYLHGGNAGIFLWVNLGRWMTPKTVPTSEEPGFMSAVNRRLAADPDANREELTVYLQREAGIIQRCLKEGVMIAKGSNFNSEELGWFRITFTADEKALKLGLERLSASLASVKA